jgi:hypothetical protein
VNLPREQCQGDPENTRNRADDGQPHIEPLHAASEDRFMSPFKVLPMLSWGPAAAPRSKSRAFADRTYHSEYVRWLGVGPRPHEEDSGSHVGIVRRLRERRPAPAAPVLIDERFSVYHAFGTLRRPSGAGIIPRGSELWRHFEENGLRRWGGRPHPEKAAVTAGDSHRAFLSGICGCASYARVVRAS